jgi:thiol-disulfide isomerase/thioredoxin
MAVKKTVKHVKHIYFFYGQECPWCHKMMPNVEQIELELGIVVQKLEVWHDEKNAKILEKLNKGRCGGVPFMINTKNDKWICGFTDASEVRELCI